MIKGLTTAKAYYHLQKLYTFFPVWDVYKVKDREIAYLKWKREAFYAEHRLLKREREQLQLAPILPVVRPPRLQRELARLA